MTLALVAAWIVSFLAITFIPPIWAPKAKRAPLREMLSSVYFAISVLAVAGAYLFQEASGGRLDVLSAISICAASLGTLGFCVANYMRNRDRYNRA